jgi:protein TonB
MTAYANTNDEQSDRLGRYLTWAFVLHGVAFAGIIAWSILGHLIHGPHWGESVQQSGSIQANLVSAIPLPQKAPPVEKQVLASEDVEKVPAPQPKVSTQPPPKPDDILIKGKTPEKAQPKPTEVTAPKHPQPTPDTPKANSGAQATQFPQTTTPLKNGTATVTVEDKVFGSRYAYYLQLVGRLVNQNYNPPASSGGKSVTVVFDIQRDGTVANLRTDKPSGFSALDIAASRAIQSVDSFGPLPAGDHITIEYKFDAH